MVNWYLNYLIVFRYIYFQKLLINCNKCKILKFKEYQVIKALNKLNFCFLVEKYMIINYKKVVMKLIYFYLQTEGNYF